MAKTIRGGGGSEGARRRGRQKKRWDDNIREWSGMGFGDSLRAAEDREGWKGIVATSSVVHRRPPRFKPEMRNEIDLITRSNRYFRRVLKHSSNGDMFTISPVAYLPMHRVKMSKCNQTKLPSEIALRLVFRAIKTDKTVLAYFI